MDRYSDAIRKKASDLRREGFSYKEICRSVGRDIPKATMYHWFKNIVPTSAGASRLERLQSLSLARAQQASVISRAKRRKEYILEKEMRNAPLLGELSSDSVQKIVIAVLYLAEGTKSKTGHMTFGNSNPGIIMLFLRLLRQAYALDEKKFRCTLQARSDQDIFKLEQYWSSVTKIPLSQFYKARIDTRSIGKISTKKDYKGVCRINYFSADLLYEVTVIGNLLTQGPVAQLVERANGIREVGGS